jgi:hypothetical protein
MARYLVVAHQTAECGELLEHLHRRSADDPDAEFVLLVPATPVDHLLVWEEGETEEVAARRAQHAAATMRDAGIRVSQCRVGDQSPVIAVQDELRRDRRYAGIILSTFRPGISRWIGLDVVSRLRSQVQRPVTHVTAERIPARTA